MNPPRALPARDRTRRMARAFPRPSAVGTLAMILNEELGVAFERQPLTPVAHRLDHRVLPRERPCRLLCGNSRPRARHADDTRSRRRACSGPSASLLIASRGGADSRSAMPVCISPLAESAKPSLLETRHSCMTLSPGSVGRSCSSNALMVSSRRFSASASCFSVIRM
jgi:hypothetical protein